CLMAWEEDSCICLNMQLIAILSRIGVFYDRILFMWHYVRILCNYEVLFRNKYQGIFLSLRILVISA
ncbi:hypothetical protein ABG827_14235, partial [Phocaeicola vulgatus]